jgi:hypothetical protein
MTKLEETLTILDFYGKRIKGKNDFLIKNKSFNIDSYVKENLRLGKNPNEISVICKDILLQIHTYFSINIIDLVSFKNEYDNYFIEDITDEKSTKEKIKNFKNVNKDLKKKVAWNKLENIRNKVLAHNLRDKNNSYKLSIEQLEEVNTMFNNLNEFTSKIESFNVFFEKFQKEFETEIKKGYESYKLDYTKLKSEKIKQQ